MNNPLTPAEQAATKTLLDKGAAPGHSIHSWRCEHPDRYGKCSCVEETAKEVVAKLRPLIAAETLREAADAWPHPWPIAGHDWLNARAAKLKEQTDD